MTRELCSEGWAVDKVRIMNQIKPKYRKWTPGVTRTIDKDKCNRSVIDPYDYEPLQLLSILGSSCPLDASVSEYYLERAEAPSNERGRKIFEQTIQ